MNLVSRAVLLSLVVASAALGAEETGLFCPLAIEANPALTESPDALQKRFLSVAREKSGYALLLRKEAEDAVKDAKVVDYASSDVSLGKIAATAKVENAGYVSLRLTERNELMLQGRVVRADGKLIKASMLSTPVGKQPLLDALAFAAERFFDQLNGKTPAPVPGAAPVQVAGTEKVPEVVKPVEPMNPGTPLRILGIVLGTAGIATTVAGAVVFGGAGTIRQDANRNVHPEDAPRVAQVRSQQGVALGLITAGAALGITGIVMTIAAPTAPVTAAIAPRADGAVFVVEGNF
jgi:hypothetical protein